jgi:hypothetical protein
MSSLIIWQFIFLSFTKSVIFNIFAKSQLTQSATFIHLKDNFYDWKNFSRQFYFPENNIFPYETNFNFA